MPTTSFRQLLDRSQDGDQAAARELFQRFSGHVRRVIRFNIGNPVINRTLDSSDICQSVFADLFARMRVEAVQCETPGQFGALLAGMARKNSWPQFAACLRSAGT